MLRQDIIDAIGKTPLVKLRLDAQAKGSVFAKLELLNPFGMKDRTAKTIILNAKQTGELKDDAPIIESSSGTMAAGVALVGTYLGHEVHIVTDPRIDDITFKKLEAMGCKVHVVSKMTTHGWQSARLEKLADLMKQFPNAFWPRQYENPYNPLAYRELADELIEAIGSVDILVASVGSGGSLSGTASALKERNPNLKVVAVDCVGSAIFGQPDYPKRLQGGLGNSLVPLNVKHNIMDEVHWLNDEEAFAATLELARKEKIFAGNSSGSVYAVARWLSSQVSNQTKIVAIFPDRGDRYVHTIYNEEYRLQNNVNELRLPQSPQQVPCNTVVKNWSYSLLKGEALREKSIHLR